MHPFPEATLGHKKVLIAFPEEKNELLVELFAGKTVTLDTCNVHFLAGTLHKKELEGWGYPFFELETEGFIGSTKMYCSDEILAPKFVHTQAIIERFNPNLPIVVYVPIGYEVRYRLWRGEDSIQKTDK